MRNTVLLWASMFIVVVTAQVLSSATAFAELRIGTDNSETLVGTNSKDLINGKGGNDTLQGLAGNDVYYFADNFGTDTLEEKVTYKVGDKRVPGGTDTLNFSKVANPMAVYLIPEWRSAGSNFASILGYSSALQLGSSVVENATGGLSDDTLYGGGATNTLKPGGGNNRLLDYGGNNGSIVGNADLPDLPASSDTYKGFGATPSNANNYITDWGGAADKLVLPGEVSDYYLDAVSQDGNPAINETLQVYNPTTNTSVYVRGQLGEFYNFTSLYGLHGQIEELVFSDGAFSTAGIQGQSLQSQSLSGGGPMTTTSSVAREAEKEAH